MESHRKHAHPMRYGAAVLFSDFTVAIASQKVALEYGCTLDAVGQLASTIDRKALQVIEDNPTCRPILLVQCDHFGIAHAPFAQGRAFLSERGYGDCKVLIHQQKKKKTQGDSNEEDDLGVSVSNGMNVEEGEGEETYAPLLAKVEPDSREFPANLMSEHKKGARLGATVLVGFLAILAKAVVIPLGKLIVGGIMGVLKK